MSISISKKTMTKFKNNITKFPNTKNKCPVCKLPSSRDDDPFCSTKCSDLDLGKWFEGKYVISEPLSSDNPNVNLLDDEKE